MKELLDKREYKLLAKLISKYLGFFCLILFCKNALCQTDTLRIYINSGSLELIDSTFVNTKAFTKDTTFAFDAQLFEVEANRNTLFQFINRDSIAHNIKFKNWQKSITVEAFSNKDTLLLFAVPGYFSLMDENPNEAYLGLSAPIVVAPAKNSFFWNIKELQASYNLALQSENTIDFNDYNPNYFLINGKSNPAIGLDPLAKIRGKVGDTLSLYIHNSGNSVHSLHFHGYHFTILYSDQQEYAVGWEKDTYAVQAGENVILQIVPDKPGEYPVHDHNLIATTANNIYPNGMFITMVITP